MMLPILSTVARAAIPFAALTLIHVGQPAGAATVARVAVSGPQAKLSGDADGLELHLSVSRNTTRAAGRPVTQTFLYYELYWCDPGPWPEAAAIASLVPTEPLPPVPCRTFASGHGYIPYSSFVAGKSGAWRLSVVPASVPGFRFEGSGGLISIDWSSNGEMSSRFHGTMQSRFGGVRRKQTGRWTEQSADASGTVFGFALRPDAAATIGHAAEMRITIEK